MHSISNSVRRTTRDLDLDFIKYSLDDKSIIGFIDRLNSVGDNITVEIVGKIEELHHQDYSGKGVYIKISDVNNYEIDTKLDIGVHKLFELEQDNYYFNLNAMEDGVSLLINSPEQIFTEKLKSFQVIIFDDNTMFEETLENIYSRLNSIFKSNAYKRNLTNPKNNWLDIPINDAIEKVLNYIEELSKETAGI